MRGLALSNKAAREIPFTCVTLRWTNATKQSAQLLNFPFTCVTLRYTDASKLSAQLLTIPFTCVTLALRINFQFDFENRCSTLNILG